MDRTLSGAEGYKFRDILPEPFRDLEKLPRRVQSIENTDSFGGIRSLINSEILSNKALGLWVWGAILEGRAMWGCGLFVSFRPI